MFRRVSPWWCPGTPHAVGSSALHVVLLFLTLAVLGCGSSTTALPPTRPVGSPMQAGVRTHVVANGETLAGIAEVTGVPVSRLAELNHLVDINVVEEGQVLRLDDTGPPQPRDTGRFPQPERDLGREALRWVRSQASAVASVSAEELRDQAIAYGEHVGANPAMVWGFAVPGFVIGTFAVWYVLAGIVRGAVRLGRSATGAIHAPSTSMLVATSGTPSAAGERTLVTQSRPESGLLEPLERALAAHGDTGAASHEPGVGARTVGAIGATAYRAAEVVGIGARSCGTAVRAGAWTVGRRLLTVPDALAARARTRTARRGEPRARRAALDRWWQPGVEAMRIGLLDEASELFGAGLADAEQRGWVAEAQTYVEALARVNDLRRRRSGAETTADSQLLASPAREAAPGTSDE